MTFEEFEVSVAANSEPAEGLAPALQALWWDAKGDWNLAHEACQGAGTSDGDWVHAYLHRKEGDISNARYWYSRCGKPEFSGTLEDEWASIAKALIDEG